MITPNMGKWNMDVFLFLTHTVPAFSMFRNMGSKFGLGMAFVCAFGVFISLVILMEVKGRLWKWIACTLLSYSLSHKFLLF